MVDVSPASDTPQIRIDNVSVRFVTPRQNVEALRDFSLDVNDKEFLCIVGPSGCGKTSLLYLIAGLLFPLSGEVIANGKKVTGPGSDRMMLFQEASLFPWLNVIENVMFGLKLRGKLSKQERIETAMHYLQLVGIDKFRNAHIHELSGGMKQRVALARALAPDPQTLLMDEPFGALDAMTREQFYGDLQSICKQHGKTVVFVTHNVSEAACLGDRVIVMTGSPGRNSAEFIVKLPRPRDIRSLEVAQYASQITQALRMQHSEEPTKP